MKIIPILAFATFSVPVKAIEGHKLNKPNSSDGTTMFDRLGPKRTGIDFTREWKPPVKWAAEISGSFTGGGVCLGDFDRDGDADLFLSRMTDGGRLYRNLGDFKFEDVTEEMGMASPGLWSTLAGALAMRCIATNAMKDLMSWPRNARVALWKPNFLPRKASGRMMTRTKQKCGRMKVRL